MPHRPIYYTSTKLFCQHEYL